MKRLSLVRVSLVLISLALVVVSVSALPQTSSDGAKPLPELSLHSLEGKKVPSADLKGKILVLDFWATWCAPCIAEVPHLNKLQEKYEDRGVKVVGVTMASGEAKEVKPFVTRFKINYSVLMGNDDQAYDLSIFAFPTTYLVNRDMTVVRKYIGMNPLKSQQLDIEIQKLLTAEATAKK